MPICELCRREVGRITRHHLIPKQKGGTSEQTTDVCRPCHRTIHATYSNTTLVQEYNSLEKLRGAPDLQPYLRWIQKRDNEHIPIRRRRK